MNTPAWAGVTYGISLLLAVAYLTVIIFRERVPKSPFIDFGEVNRTLAANPTGSERQPPPAAVARASGRPINADRDAGIVATVKALPPNLHWIIEQLANGEPKRLHIGYGDLGVLVSQVKLLHVRAFLDPRDSRDVIVQLAPGVAHAVEPYIQEVTRQRALKAGKKPSPPKGK